MLSLAKSIHGVAIKPDELDKNQYLLNVKNGTINLKTGELQAFNPLDLITKIIDVEYHPDDQLTDAPHWFDFLAEIFEGDVEVIKYVQRVAGYSLTGDISERKIFFLWGEGRNGKSTFVNALAHVLGADYSKRIPISSLLKKKNEAVPNDIAALRGTRFAYSSEAPEGKQLDEAFVKDASGGENITARFMRGEWFQFKPEFKLWLSTNHKPEITGSDAAIWDRISLIPFKFRVSEDEIDPNLSEKLLKEARFILKWAVIGCISWQKQGLKPPEIVRQGTEDYKKEMNNLPDFMQECCEYAKDYAVRVSDLYEAYKNYSGNSSIHLKKFNNLVKAAGHEAPKTGTGNYAFWNGFKLKQ